MDATACCVRLLLGALLKFLMLKFLCRVADVLSDYLGGLNEDLIKDNFVTVFQVSCFILITA